VTEVHTAFEHLKSRSLTLNDWKVFGYLVGRGALWMSVGLAVWSMYDYLKFFFRAKQRNEAPAAASTETT